MPLLWGVSQVAIDTHARGMRCALDKLAEMRGVDLTKPNPDEEKTT